MRGVVASQLAGEFIMDLALLRSERAGGNVMSYKKFLAAASAALTIIVVIFMLTPGTWAQSKGKTLYEFTGGTDGSQPFAGVGFHHAGNLYGTTFYCGTPQKGPGFVLSPQASDGGK